MNKDVVGTDAQLAAIHKSHGGSLVGSIVEVTRLINDHRALTAQLKNARNKILGSGSRHESTFLCASSEHNQVGRLRSGSNGHIYGTIDALICVCV